MPDTTIAWAMGRDGYHPIQQREPLRVAAIGPLTGMLPPEPSADFTPPSPEAQAATMLLAAHSDLPRPEDLAETIDVQLTPAIRAKAAELGNNPRKIYEWVRNNVEFAPTWGSIQGTVTFGLRGSKTCRPPLRHQGRRFCPRLFHQRLLKPILA